MFYKIVADITVFIHLIWILFLIFGVFWGVRYRIVKIVHISGVMFAIVIQIFGWYCPLTHLEVWLRSNHDPSLSYSGSFIIHYVEKIVYLDLSRTLVFFATVFLAVFMGWMYLRKT